MKNRSNASQARSLEDVRSHLEDILFALSDVAAISVKSAEVKVSLVHDSPDVRSRIDTIVHQQHPGARLHYEVTGEFRPL